MTERELKAMYENASLPEERMAELEKRFISMVNALPQDAHVIPVLDEESVHVELKPERRSPRPLSAVFGVCGAAAAMVALVVGVTLAYKGGYIGTAHTSDESGASQDSQSSQTSQTSQVSQDSQDSQSSQTNETENALKITQDMLPEYPDKGSRHSVSVTLDSSLADHARSDIDSGAAADTELFALFTITGFTEVTGEEVMDSDYTCYTMEVETVYYAALGHEAQPGDEFRVYLYGTSGAQYDGCPPFGAGDRVAAAIKQSEKGSPAVYVLAAEYAIADVLTIDGRDYAAVRSSEFPPIQNADLAADAPLERVTTCLTNPARYFHIYDCSDFGTFFFLYIDEVKNTAGKMDDMFNISMLGFGTDSAAMSIFEDCFSGAWKHDNPVKSYDDVMALSYTPNALHASTTSYAPEYGYDAALMQSYSDYTAMYGTGDSVTAAQGARCEGFLSTADAAFMKVTVNGKRTIYAVPYDTPETMYCYVTEEDVFRRDSFYDRWQLERRLSTDMPESGLISRFGLMKLLSSYPEDFADMVWKAIDNGFTDESGTAWSRYSSDGTEQAGFITLNSATESSLTISLPFFSNTRLMLTSDSGEPYLALPSRRFCLSFSGTSCTRTVCSGDPADMSSFFSPLESAEMFPTRRTKRPAFDSGSGITVTYYSQPRGGLIDVYAVRNLGYADAGGLDLCEIYWRDPLTDEYRLLYTAYSPSVMISGGSVYLWCTPTGFGYDDRDFLSRFIGANAVELWHADDRSFGTELYESGEYILAHRNVQSEMEWLVFAKNALGAGCEVYADNELDLSKDGFTTTRGGSTVVHDAAGESLDGMLQALTARLLNLWSAFEIDSPAGTSNETVYDAATGITGYGMLDSSLRTRKGILSAFEKVLTPAAAEDALAQITGHSVVLVDGQYYTTGGARGANLGMGRQEYSAQLSADGQSAVVTYTVYGSDLTDMNDKVVETYTINAVKTDVGWRLDRFYQPY